MATALDLKLKPGDKVLIAQGIWVEESPGDFLKFSEWQRRPSIIHKGYTYWRAPTAEILEVDDEGNTKIKYENGGEKSLASSFEDFSRERTRLQRLLDPIKYFLNRYTTLRV